MSTVFEKDGAKLKCSVCDWSFPLSPDGDEIDQIIWKSVSLVHAALQHPKEFGESVGNPEERLAVYQDELGEEVWPFIKALAIGGKV